MLKEQILKDLNENPMNVNGGEWTNAIQSNNQNIIVTHTITSQTTKIEVIQGQDSSEQIKLALDRKNNNNTTAKLNNELYLQFIGS
jgi:hypothetical protein